MIDKGDVILAVIGLIILIYLNSKIGRLSRRIRDIEEQQTYIAKVLEKTTIKLGVLKKRFKQQQQPQTQQ